MLTRRDCIKLLVIGGGCAVIRTYHADFAFADTPLDVIGLLSKYTSTDGVTSYIEAVDLALVQDILPGTASVFIRSDIVRFSGSVSLPSQNLTILARRFICTGSPTLSTASTGTIRDFTNQSAGVGTSNGADGQLGQDGQNGGNGGNITIVVGSLEGSLNFVLSGQNGGGAQSGGNGAPGQPGVPWPNSQIPSGGNGGSLPLASLHSFAAGQVNTTSVKGSAGAPGRYGVAGTGGQPAMEEQTLHQ